MIGPDIGEVERPDADENIDEDLDCGGCPKQPAGLVVHASRGRLGEEKRLGDALGGHGSAVGLHRETNPCRGDEGFVRKEGLRLFGCHCFCPLLNEEAHGELR